MKIIVVDDEEDVQLLFRQKFRKEIKSGQIEFYFASSAEIALKYLENLENARASLIISDVNMPGMSGIELLKIVKQRFNYIKLFIMTAYNDIHMEKILTEYQADEFITKPVNFEKLKSRIFSL